MKSRDLMILLLAAGCGFLGGSAATRLQPNLAQGSDVIRTSRLDLVDTSGKRRAVLGIERSGRQPSLSLLNEDGKAVGSFGLDSGQRPFIMLFGVDGRIRAALELTTTENPYLVMGDGIREAPRVLLGAIEGDVLPAKPADADWALQFLNRSDVSVVSEMGMIHNPADQSFSGMLFIKNPKESFRVPQRRYGNGAETGMMSPLAGLGCFVLLFPRLAPVGHTIAPLRG